LFFFVVMKGFYICLFFVFFTTSGLLAQELDSVPNNIKELNKLDSVPINTKDLNLKLNRSPLPSRIGNLIFTPVILQPVIINSKVNYWKTKTAIGLNVNQAAFSDNWTGGGVNSLALSGLINYKAEYNKESYSYVSEVILNYGKVKNKNQLQKKTVDRIYWDNKAAIQLSKNWYFFGSATFESQFDNGFAYFTENGEEKARIISSFMSPGYLTESIGFEYKPSKFFSTRIGTGTARQTFVLDNDELFRASDAAGDTGKLDNYGVTRGNTFRNDLAFQIVTSFEKDIFQNVNLKTKYLMFIPYDNPSYTNYRLDVMVTAKVNRFMNVSVAGVGLYDKNTADKIQASQTLALGIMFIFPR
jgi:hypothetical protein